MFLKLHLSRWVLTLLTFAEVLPATEMIKERPPFAGVWVNTRGKAYDLDPYRHFLAGEADRVHWNKVQAQKNVFDFSSIGQSLKRVKENNMYWYCEFWTGHFTAPEWIYQHGVPRVLDKKGSSYPYYLNDQYKKYLRALFHAFTEYLSTLPPELIKRIAFIQPGFGSTGDRQLYKGEPVDPQYHIDAQEYFLYMKQVTEMWTEAFQSHSITKGIRFLWNIDDHHHDSSKTIPRGQKGGEMLYSQWLRKNHDGQFRKQQFSLAIGYMACHEAEKDAEQRPMFYGTEFNGDTPEFIRGEFNDSKWAKVPMARVAPKWNYYWTAISSVDRGLDAWETKPKFLMSGKYNEAFEFSHRYSFYKRPESSPHAFVAMRQVLDYSNIQRFPERIYGKAHRKNKARLNKILQEYKNYGAVNDDTDAVIHTSEAKYLLESQGLNDCVWRVIDRNYQRHMTQIDPDATSVGWWRVGSKQQPYGRFARAFEHDTGKNAMSFALSEKFCSQSSLLRVKVIYFDEWKGSRWKLCYSNENGLVSAAEVICSGDQQWKTKVFSLDKFDSKGIGPDKAHLFLVNQDALNDKFHLMEVSR